MEDADGAPIADYFSVVGASNDGELKLLDPDLHTPEYLKCVWEDAITDVTVVRTGKGERCPDGYELIERTPMDHSADLNHGSITSWGLKRAVHLAVRRQDVSKREDYIAEMQVLYGDSESLPEGRGWELVQGSTSGKRANLNKGGVAVRLAVRRVVRSAVNCPPALCSVCVFLRNKGEHPPPGYRVIGKDLNKGKCGDVVHVAYQLGDALSICQLPFRSMILDRYPEEDSDMFPFPGDQLPMFVYPKGMLLEQRSGHDTPKSSFFSFVFTNVDGRRTYTACLTFYEPMAPSAARRLERKIFSCRPEPSRDHHNPGLEQATQGRMRIGLRGSASTGRLGSLPQHSGPRPRSGKGTWSRVGSGGHNSLPRQLVHGGMGAGGSGRSSASWTKMSAATRTPPYTSGHEPSPSQPLAAKILSNADAPPSQARCSSPINHTGRVGAFDDVGSGGHVDGPRWTGDKVPFRDPWHRALGLSTKDDSLAGGGESKTTETVKPVLLNPLVADNSMQCARGTSPSLQTNGSCVGADESRTCAAEAGLGFDLSDAEFDRLCHSEDRHCIFAPKTICVISRFPIYSVLRRFLRHLYAISLSRSGVPLERYISMFVSCIPMPSPGGCPFHVYLEPLENEDPRRSRLKPLTLQMPPDSWLPLMDIDFTAPFRCLSVRSVLTVFALMLQEAKIIFLSSRAELLNQVMEALRSLLFPLEWQSVYVPQLPYALSGYLECPGGFMIGMLLTKGELEKGTGGTASVVRDLGLEGVANAVNLDAGEVLLYSGDLINTADEPVWRDQTLQITEERGQNSTGADSGRGRSRNETREQSREHSTSCLPTLRDFCCKRPNAGGPQVGGLESFIVRDEERATPWLPESLRAGLAFRLEHELFGQAAVRIGVEEDLDQYESAFEFAPAPDRTDTFSSDGYGFNQRMVFGSDRMESVNASGTTGQQTVDRSDVERGYDTALIVRDCFLCCMTELLGGIGDSVNSGASRSNHNLRTKPLYELFDMKHFMEGMSSDARPFLQRLTSTQMFCVMIQQWLGRSRTDGHLSFFEECAFAAQNRRAGAVVPCCEQEEAGPRDANNWVTRQGIADGRENTYRSAVEFLGGYIPHMSKAEYVLMCHACTQGSLKMLVSPDTERQATINWFEIDGSFLDSLPLNQHNFVPLVNEIWLKHPDRYRLNSHNLYGSSCLEGSRSTPMATPLSSENQTVWDSNCGPVTRAASKVNLAAPKRHGQASEHSASSRTKRDQNGGIVNATAKHGARERRDSSQDIQLDLTKPLAPLSQNPSVPSLGQPVNAIIDTVQSDTVLVTTAREKDDTCAICTGPPIIIPGPTTEGLPEKGQLFRYDDGWPTPLNPVLLHSPPEALPPVVLKLQHHATSQARRHVQGAEEGYLVSVPQRDKQDSIESSFSQAQRSTGRVSLLDRRLRTGRSRLQPGYRGDKRCCHPHGRGKMVYRDGSVYDGEWRQGRRHGQGSMQYDPCNHYSGEWRSGKKDGLGTMTYPDGARYEGNWLGDERHGQGTYIYASGGSYRGGWAEGWMHGLGCYTSVNGARYEGMYRRGQRYGHGKMSYSGGQLYVGDWAYGVRNGFGTYTLPDGTIFEGNFKQDLRHGTGIIRRANGAAVGQLWAEGKLVGTST